MDTTTDLDSKNDDSEEEIKKILLATTKIPRTMKTRANTEVSNLNSLEPTTTTISPKPKKMKKVKDENGMKIEAKLNVPQISSLPLNQEKPKKPEKFEYYYTYEDYAVNEDGVEITGNGKAKDQAKKKVLIKHRRDNSEEYYAESISASHEDRKLNLNNEYDISI